ncbi:MAG: SH3 domain-containing protein [Acutalibacteraceae bacterium]
MTRSHIGWLCAVSAVFVLLSAVILGGCSAGGGETTTTTSSATAPAVTTTTFAPLEGTLTASEVIVRDGPGFGYDAIGGMANGEEFTIVGHEGDWYRITFGDGYGYISAAYAEVEGQPNASQMVADFTTVSRTATTSRTKPQSPTTTTATAAGTTNKTAVTAATSAAYIPDTTASDSF